MLYITKLSLKTSFRHFYENIQPPTYPLPPPPPPPTHTHKASTMATPTDTVLKARNYE